MKIHSILSPSKAFSLMFALMLLVPGKALSQRVLDIDLWPDKPQYDSANKADTARVRVFLPSGKGAVGRAVVMCPGGGYSGLSLGHEGYEWANFFNSQGIALIVLKYRMPHGNRHVPISDAEEAMRLVRRNAKDWHIDPNDVGIMGFSAGGHLASTIATHSKDDARPNFQILIYPVITMQPSFTHMGSHNNLLGKGASKGEEEWFSNEMQVKDDTPRAFIALSDDDEEVEPANSVNYYLALLKHHVPANLLVYPSGGHGYGINTSFKYHYELLNELQKWLKD